MCSLIGVILPFLLALQRKTLPPCRYLNRTRTRALHFRGTTLLRPALAGKTLCWRKNQPGALTDATPSRAHCSPVQAPRPCSAPRGLPASILRAFCQAQTMRTLLFSANAIIMFIIRKKSGFVNKNMKKEPSQSKPAGFDSSPKGRAFEILRHTQKSSPFGTDFPRSGENGEAKRGNSCRADARLRGFYTS